MGASIGPILNAHTIINMQRQNPKCPNCGNNSVRRFRLYTEAERKSNAINYKLAMRELRHQSFFKYLVFLLGTVPADGETFYECSKCKTKFTKAAEIIT